MSDDDKKDDMSREIKETIHTPDNVLRTVEAHLGRLENVHFEPDDGSALLSQEQHKCGDGRDDRLERFGIFGGTVGLMASGIANLDKIEAAGQHLEAKPDDVIEAMVEKLDGISCHTDTHSGHGLHSGCGHVARLIKNPEKYGLTGRYGKAFINFLRKIDEEGSDSRVHSVSYSGHHNEIAVVQVVNGEGYRLRVRGFDKATGIQVFVWHTTEVDRAAAELSEWLYDYAEVYVSSSISKHDFRDHNIKIINKQMLTTGQELAPGFQIIQVQPRGNQILDIKAIGTVPVPQ